MRRSKEELNSLFTRLLDVCFQLHTNYGPGMLESFYEAIICHELTKAKISFKRQVGIKVVHDGINMGLAYRIDILVEDEIIIEIKSKSDLAEADHKQIITYLKTTNKRLGLLVNFGVAHLKDGIHRKVHRF